MYVTWRITSEIDKRKLYFLQFLVSANPSTLYKEIFIRRLFRNFDPERTQGGFIPDILNILDTYGLTQYLTDYIDKHHFPNKWTWKRIVKSAIDVKEENLLRQRMNSDSDFKRFQYVHNTSYRPYTLLDNSKIKANVKIYICKMLTCSLKQHSFRTLW